MLKRKNRFIVFFLLLFLTVCSIFPIGSFAAPNNTIKLNAESGKNGIKLTWNSITHEKGVKGYYVFRSTKPGKYPDIPETDFWIDNKTEYLDTKLTPNTTYYYIVRPVLGDGTLGTPSNEKQVNYKGTSNDFNLRATVNTGSITLKWNRINGPKEVIGYYVYKATRSGKQTNTPETDFWIKETSYVDKKVIPGTTYYYIVRPVFSDKTIGDPSNEVKVTCQNIYGTISMTIGNRVMLVNGKYMEIDPGQKTAPVIKDGRTMLPIRALIEAMGGSVAYDSGSKKITVKWNDKTILLWIDQKNITVNGNKKTIDVAPYISDSNRTMVPLRFVLENLGCGIDWDGDTMTATISYLLDKDGYYPQSPPDYDDDDDDVDVKKVWSGVWQTSKGKLTLTQNGIYVSGILGDSLTLEGVVNNGKLIGTFFDRGNKYGFEFTLSKDGLSFKGIYGQMNKPTKQWSDWTGNRK